jgi:uncharacterized membrane protein YfcA
MKVDTEPPEEKYARQQRKRVLLITAVFLGAAAGVFIGILGMAVGMLLVNTLSLVVNTSAMRLPGINMPTATFVLFFAIGSAVSTSYIWRKSRAENQ